MSCIDGTARLNLAQRLVQYITGANRIDWQNPNVWKDVMLKQRCDAALGNFLPGNLSLL